jgi:hypothetical protein
VVDVEAESHRVHGEVLTDGLVEGFEVGCRLELELRWVAGSPELLGR